MTNVPCVRSKHIHTGDMNGVVKSQYLKSIRRQKGIQPVSTAQGMNSDSIFHQCFSQQGLHKSQSDCSLEFKTLRRNDSFFKPKDKEKEKIRRHLPIGTGDYSVGCLDIMCDHSEKGSFFRLYYPIEKTDIYVSVYSLFNKNVNKIHKILCITLYLFRYIHAYLMNQFKKLVE